jgi:deazaflavin-dependent oxidoreductase (nitroreductase family)
MMYVADGDRLLVIASNNGATSDPLWYGNLVANPSVTVELPGQSYPAVAEPLDGDDYDTQWAAIQAKYPFFTEHQVRAGGRRIPVVALTKAG